MTVLGILNNELIIDSFYAGDSYHSIQIDDYTKADLISCGCRQFSSIDEVDALMHGLTLEQYLRMIEQSNLVTTSNQDDDLPF